MLFWKLPNNKFFTFVPRSGSTAWAQAILDTFYPELKSRQCHANTPNHKLAKPQFFIPHTRRPDGEILGIIRDPIERFKSGFSRAAHGASTSDFITSLTHQRLVNTHIRPITTQFKGFVDKIKWYCYDTQLKQLATDIGLSDVPAALNRSIDAKPTLTDADLSILNEFYAKDIELYNKYKG